MILASRGKEQIGSILFCKNFPYIVIREVSYDTWLMNGGEIVEGKVYFYETEPQYKVIITD